MGMTFWTILSVALVIGALLLLRRNDGGYLADYQRFMDSARDRGLDYHDAMHEWDIRTAFSRLRSDASAAVRRDPGNWWEHLEAAKKSAIERMAITNPALVPTLAGMMAGVSYGHILYPEEAHMVDRLSMDELGVAVIDQDELRHQRAALRVVREG